MPDKTEIQKLYTAMRKLSTRGEALHYIAAVLKGEQADESFRMRALEDALSDRWRSLSDEQHVLLQYVISNYPDLDKQSSFFGKMLVMAAMFCIANCSPMLPPVMAKNPALRYGAGFVFVCHEEPSILLGKRSRHGDDPGTWAGFGGGVNSGESAKAAAEREVKEEAGSMPHIDRVLATLRYENDGLVFVTFIANLSKEEKQRWSPKRNFEHDEIRWHRKLPNNLHPGLAAALKGYLDGTA